MRRSKRSRRRKSNSDFFLKLGSALVICLVVGAISAALIFKPSVVTLDSDNCPINLAGGHELLIAVDTTDFMSERTVTEIRNRISAKIENAPEFSRIQLFEINEDSSGHTRALFSSCKPPTGANANELIENPALIRKRFKENFDKPLKSVMKKLLEPKNARQSPIIEAIASITVESRGSVSSEATDREFILVSDLVQHSNLFSMFREFPKYTDFQQKVMKTGTGNFSLQNMAVELWVPPREVPIGSRSDLIRFWLDLLIDRNAQAGTRVVPLS